jgi:ATP-binding cassette subfamily B protein
MDCGYTCLKMVAAYYKKSISIKTLREYSSFARNGVSLLGISQAAEKLGFQTTGYKLTYEQLSTDAQLPCIVHFNQNHFVVVTPNINNKTITVADPAAGLIKYTKHDFLKSWLTTNTTEGDNAGIALLLKPTKEFYKLENEKETKVGFKSIAKYLFEHKQYFTQIVISLLLGSLLQLLFPFLTQSIVDTGINTHNINYITIVLIAQLTLYISKTIIEFVRSRLLLYISTRINISILSDFWIKLMKLPLSYFDTKQVGDTLQRIGDHKRIEQFLTYSSISTLFSIINIFIFSIVLLIYSTQIFFIFLVGSILYFLWIRIFLKFRRNLDVQRFNLAAKENSATMQLIYGMQEIKINNSEQLKRWKWEDLQSKLFNLNFKSLSISQYQQAGALFINEGKNIIITFLVATAVINGQLTLGAMLAIQYIVGQLNSPIEQLIQFVQQAQDAKISLERLNEIHQLDDEDKNQNIVNNLTLQHNNITISNLSFTYPGAGNEPVLDDINIEVPQNKTTAIVGMSGSGKTTLLKLLQQFYNTYTGDINIGATALKNINPTQWRSLYGCVMQDGYILAILLKIILQLETKHNHEQLVNACKVANILHFVNSLPLGFNTIIGAEGNGISQGQKQRILIARAVYKNPQFVFFDEATNALDANNEKAIMENLQTFFNGRTVIVVAHRLSTVKNADNIVLHEGTIVEQGTHIELTKQQGYYYDLVKNQLELGN